MLQNFVKWTRAVTIKNEINHSPGNKVKIQAVIYVFNNTYSGQGRPRGLEFVGDEPPKFSVRMRPMRWLLARLPFVTDLPYSTPYLPAVSRSAALDARARMLLERFPRS